MANNIEKTIEVSSLSEFINHLPEEVEFYDTIANKLTLYRGQADITWPISPSVFRNKDDFLNEDLYIKEFQRNYPEEFNNLSKIEILAKMQHYGIPTRLLDLTSNPLVALYFACASSPEKDGVVFAFNQAVFKAEQELVVDVLMEYIFNFKSHSEFWVPRFEDGIRKKLGLQNAGNGSENYIESMVTSSYPVVLSAQLSNPRVKNQDGYFALYRGITPAQTQNNLKPIKEILIRAENKSKIINQLYRIGIHPGKLFLDLSSGANFVVNTIRQQNFDFNKNKSL